MATVNGAHYDTIGVGYAAQRRTDPRIAARIGQALGDARRVLNVGAGTGSYEPTDRVVVAVEPSAVMLAQRSPGAAPALEGVAEALPLASGSFDAAMASITIHHWQDPPRGLTEMVRVSRRRVVFTFDPMAHTDFWLIDEYFPAMRSFGRDVMHPDEVAELLGADGAPSRIEVVPVPADCVDGFNWAHWRRPERYLRPEVRAATSAFSQMDPSSLRPGLDRLASDLASGAWHRRHADLLELDEIDGGFRLVVAG